MECYKNKIISDLGDSKCPYISSQASKFGNEPMAGVLRSKSDKVEKKGWINAKELGDLLDSIYGIKVKE